MNAPFDDVDEAIAEGIQRAEKHREQEASAGELELLVGEPAEYEEDIPRRNYVVSGYVQRGALTEIVGPGGHGKSQLFIAWAVALALGLPFGGFEPSQPMRVLAFDVEDDIPEQQRRCAAMLRHFGRCKADLNGRLKLLNPNKAGLLVTLDPDAGKVGHTRLLGELLDLIDTFKPDLVMLNPLGELHDVTEENNNAALRRVAAELRVIAKTKDIGILLAHHTRKGHPEPGNPDAGRGASSVGGVVRKSFTLYGMTADEAASWKITRPNLHFRLDGAKANYDAKNPTEWFERIPIVLGNGDTVPMVQPWVPHTDAITDELITNLLAVIKTGDGGQPWSKRIGKYHRSISRPMAHIGIVSRNGQEKALIALIAKGVTECPFKRPNGATALGLRHPDRSPSVRWVEG
jgi:hypothetical protein